MRHPLATSLAALVIGAASIGLHAQAGDGGYKLVPNWPKLPAGMFFGLKDAPPPPAEREAQAAARRAVGAQRGAAARQNTGGPTNQPGISGLAIDRERSHLRVQPRPQAGDGVRPRRQSRDERRRSGDQRQDDQPVVAALRRAWTGTATSTSSSATPIASSSSVPSSTSFCCSSARPARRATTPTHFDLPSGIAVLRKRQHRRHRRLRQQPRRDVRKDGKFIKQVGKGAGGPAGQGHRRPGEWVLPHKLAVDADENMYIIDRENHRVQVFDKNLNYIREIHERGLEPVGHRHLAQGQRRLRATSPTTRSSACTRSR